MSVKRIFWDKETFIKQDTSGLWMWRYTTILNSIYWWGYLTILIHCLPVQKPQQMSLYFLPDQSEWRNCVCCGDWRMQKPPQKVRKCECPRPAQPSTSPAATPSPVTPLHRGNICTFRARQNRHLDKAGYYLVSPSLHPMYPQTYLQLGRYLELKVSM